MRLSQYDQALEAYSYMRHLAPTNPDAYLSMASAQLSAGRLENAAVLLLQTLLLDNSRQETLRLLVDLYRQVDRDGCAVVFDQGQPRLNLDCQVVANHMCAAYLGLVQVFVEAKQWKLAEETKKNALLNSRCKPEPFDAVLRPTVPTLVLPQPRFH
jgi:tetratricopeptide (TPR) repeat protein